MMNGRSILITGVTGKAALPIAAALAKDNEVFGQARFARREEYEAVAALGIRPCPADFAVGDFSRLPRSIDYLLHFGWMRGGPDELETAMKTNVEGAGLLLHHSRPAKAALIVSSSAVYRGMSDPLHRYREGDPIAAGPSVSAATSSTCKIGLEAVARTAARTLGLRMTIARLNTVYGPHQAFYGKKVAAVLGGKEIVLPSGHDAHNPIHSADMIDQIEPLLDAAGHDPLTVNWGGDEIVVTQEVVARIAERTGKDAIVKVCAAPGLAGGSLSDVERRLAITGPCAVRFRDGFERMLDEMLDGASATLTQRHWAYASGTQNRIFTGVDGS